MRLFIVSADRLLLTSFLQPADCVNQRLVLFAKPLGEREHFTYQFNSVVQSGEVAHHDIEVKLRMLHIERDIHGQFRDCAECALGLEYSMTFLLNDLEFLIQLFLISLDLDDYEAHL